MTVHMDPETRKRVLKILDETTDLTIATLRADGYPQATVVSFAHDGEKIYFGCDRKSQKARNIERDERVSATVTPPYQTWEYVRGLSLGGRARRVVDEAEQARVGELMAKRFPQVADFMKRFSVDDIVTFRIDPEVISILDYGRGFGHAELHEAAARRSV